MGNGNNTLKMTDTDNFPGIINDIQKRIHLLHNPYHRYSNTGIGNTHRIYKIFLQKCHLKSFMRPTRVTTSFSHKASFEYVPRNVSSLKHHKLSFQSSGHSKVTLSFVPFCASNTSFRKYQAPIHFIKNNYVA